MTIVCGDERAPKVLLFTENYQFSQPMNIDMRYLVEIAKLNILSDIKYIEKLKSEKRSSTLDKISQSLNISKEQITEDIIKRNITIIDNSNSREYNPINGIDISKFLHELYLWYLPYQILYGIKKHLTTIKCP